MEKKKHQKGMIVERFRVGNVQANIWVNCGQKNYYYKVVFEKVASNGVTSMNVVHKHKSFEPEDMESIAKLAGRVERFTRRYGPFLMWDRLVKFKRANQA